MSTEEAVYQPRDAIATSVRSTMITGAAGAFVSAIQNTLTKQNVTGWGVFTRTGSTIAVFGKPLPAQSDEPEGQELEVG